MTTEETRFVADVVSSWSIEDRVWWRSLLSNSPSEALVVARLILMFGIRPAERGI